MYYNVVEVGFAPLTFVAFHYNSVLFLSALQNTEDSILCVFARFSFWFYLIDVAQWFYRFLSDLV